MSGQTQDGVTGRVTTARFAKAARRLGEHRSLVDRLRELVSGMERTRLVPLVAERDLIRQLSELVITANQQVAQMTTGSSIQNRECMATLEQLLDRPEWVVAGATLSDLLQKRMQLDDVVRALDEERGAYRLPFSRFHKAVEEATRLRVPVTLEDRQLATEVEGRFRSSDKDFAEGRYDTVAVAIELARTMLAAHHLVAPEDFEEHTEQLERRIAERQDIERKLERRTELFLLSSAPVEKDIPFKVLLRRAGHQHIQETTLHDDVAVLQMDRELFQDIIDQIADVAIRDIRSAANLPALRRARPQRRSAPGHLDQLTPEQQLEKIGRRMYSLLIPDAMQRLVDENADFPLTIASNNPELPWELMHDGRQYLCLQRMFARMPTGQTFPRRSREAATRRDTQTRALLIASASETDLPQARQEIDEVESALTSMSPPVAVTKIPSNEVTSSRLTDEFSLGEYDLIHYAGHAGFEPDRPELSYLRLPSGERFRAERIQRLLEGHPVVFLNACESSRSGPQPPGRSTGGIVAQSQGLAAAFVYGGAQACVGSLWPVFDTTARVFAHDFYRQLITESQRVGEALRLARIASRDSQHDRVTWAAYALYGDPSYRLGAEQSST